MAEVAPMKTIGIIGGIGPESTIEYYRFILAAWRERHGQWLLERELYITLLA